MTGVATVCHQSPNIIDHVPPAVLFIQWLVTPVMFYADNHVVCEQFFSLPICTHFYSFLAPLC